MAEKVTIHVAKTNLSKLIAKAEAGEEIVICRGDKEVARIEATAKPKGKGVRERKTKWEEQAERQPGGLQLPINDSFYDPWSPKDFGPGVMDGEPDWGEPGTWDGKSPRKPGLLKGVIKLDASFFDPLTPEETGLGGAAQPKP